MTVATVKARPISEAQWQVQVTELADLYRWTHYHERDSRKVTLAGWPDLVLIREPRLLLIELKKDTGKLRPGQRELLPRLAACGLEVAVWRPRDLQTVIGCLRHAGRRAELIL